MPDESLILHWDMFEVENGKLEDASEKDNDGFTQGSPQMVPDDVFGSCLSFNEAGRRGDRIVATNIGLTGPNPAHTIEAWVYIGEYPPSRSWMLVLGQYGVGAHHWLLAPTGGTQLGVWSGDQLAPIFPKGSWVHIATVYDGQQLIYYANGVAQGNPKPARFNLANSNFAVAQGAPGELDFSGKIASIRVYNRALSGAEIALDMTDDQTAMASFRQSHPVDFNLYDDDDQQALYIDDDPAGRNLKLEVSNSSRQAIEFVKQSSDVAAAGNCHLELRFRPGTLSAASLSQIAVAESDWRLAKSPPNGGGVSLYLLSAKSRTLMPADNIKLTLQHVGADGGDGARGTRVELKYRQLKYPNDEALIEGFRAQHLSVVNQRGKKNIPLHVGFIGPNIVLNDKGVSSTDLFLRLTNVLGKDSIQWTPTGANASKLIVSVDVQGQGQNKDWALGTADQVDSLQLICAGWTVKKQGQGVSTEWVLTNEQKNKLDAGESVLLTLKGVKSSLPSGHTNLYIRYENIPGYWDGQFICVIEKAPILYRQDKVGIGIANPSENLDVAGNAAISGNVIAGNVSLARLNEKRGALFLATSGDFNHVLYNNNSNIDGEGSWDGAKWNVFGGLNIRLGGGGTPRRSALFIDGAGSVGIGIGATGPQAKLQILHVNQDANGSALILGPTEQSNLRLGYHQNYSWVQSHGSKPLAINPVGNNVGIGTTNPQAKLSVAGTMSVGASETATGIVTQVFEGRIDNGQNLSFRLYSLRSHRSSHLDILVMMHDINSDTYRLYYKAEFGWFKEWDTPPKKDLLTQTYRKTYGTDIYRVDTVASGNDIYLTLAQSGFATNSVYLAVVKYMLVSM
jgi:hypothetical protein